jgi:DNA-binding MarR family transcriptional regulator
MSQTQPSPGPDQQGSGPPHRPDEEGSKTPDEEGSKTPDEEESKTPDEEASKTPYEEESETPHWLDQEERAAWLGLIRLVTRLPSVLDAQLQHDAELSFFEYSVLAMLSEQPARVLRMSHLAAVTSASLSRLSHVARRLESRGLMRRALDPTDGRCTNAILTDDGLALVMRTAPAHVAEVRALVIDAVSPAQLRQLRRASERILSRVDPEATTQPPSPV